MPSDVLLKVVNAGHRFALRASGGRFGWRGKGMPVVELTTTGRRSGEPRTVMLTAPVHGDGRYVVVASRGGDGRTPAWFLNLRDDPDVQVATQGVARRPMRARIPDVEERSSLWADITTRYPHYGRYQDKAGRTIPLVVLEPLS